MAQVGHTVSARLDEAVSSGLNHNACNVTVYEFYNTFLISNVTKPPLHIYG